MARTLEQEVRAGGGRARARALPILPGRSVRRWTFALLGMLSVGVGFLGVFVPGLPTTIFLLLGSYCFTRSCPWLEDRLIRTRVFRPYLRYLDGNEPMPRRARVMTIAMIWIACASSCLLLWWRGALSPWFLGGIGIAALAGSVAVARAFREPTARRRNGTPPLAGTDPERRRSPATAGDLPEDGEEPGCPLHRVP